MGIHRISIKFIANASNFIKCTEIAWDCHKTHCRRVVFQMHWKCIKFTQNSLQMHQIPAKLTENASNLLKTDCKCNKSTKIQWKFIRFFEFIADALNLLKIHCKCIWFLQDSSKIHRILVIFIADASNFVKIR